MPLQLRSHKVDENNVRTAETTKAKAVVQTKHARTADTKRSALGEVGNLVKNIERATKKDDQPLKPATAVPKLRDIKPKVNSFWRKGEEDAMRTKRSESDAEGAKLVTTKFTNLPKIEVPEKGVLKKVTVTTTATVKRQESILTSRSILKQRTIKKQKDETAGTAGTGHTATANASKGRKNSAGKLIEEPAPHPVPVIDNIEDIDRHDHTNLLLTSEYVKDIFAYFNHLELAFPIQENYLSAHSEVSPKMRTILIDWICEVHLQFKLVPETFHLTISIIDRYLQLAVTMARKNLQLVGITAMFIASKYEEMYPPLLKDFIYVTDNTYTKNDVIEMEKCILKKLDFNLSPPLALHFSRRFAKAAAYDHQFDHCASKYLVELALLDYTMLHHPYSIVAAAAVFISLKIFSDCQTDDEIWNEIMQFYTTYKLDAMRPVIRKLAKAAIDAPTKKENVVYYKYKHAKFDKISSREEMTGPVMHELCDF